MGVITPLCGYISHNKALIAGVVAGTVCYAAVVFLNKMGVDDALDVWGVHGVGGAVGTVLIGVLSDGPECLKEDAPEHCVFPGSVASSYQQVKLQAKAVCICIGYSFTMTLTILKMMELVIILKPNDMTHDFGYENLDDDLHGEGTYLMA